jgi:effector-binding domain-containing protein
VGANAAGARGTGPRGPRGRKRKEIKGGDDVELVTIGQFSKVCWRIMDTTPEGISTDAPVAYQQLYESLARQSIAPAGPARLVYRQMEDDAWRIEPCVPVAGSVRPEGDLEVHDMEGGRAVTALHVGPYDELGIAWDEVSKWVAARGHKTSAQPYDVYLNDPSEVDDPAELRTELVWPIR